MSDEAGQLASRTGKPGRQKAEEPPLPLPLPLLRSGSAQPPWLLPLGEAREGLRAPEAKRSAGRVEADTAAHRWASAPTTVGDPRARARNFGSHLPPTPRNESFPGGFGSALLLSAQPR